MLKPPRSDQAPRCQQTMDAPDAQEPAQVPPVPCSRGLASAGPVPACTAGLTQLKGKESLTPEYWAGWDCADAAEIQLHGAGAELSSQQSCILCLLRAQGPVCPSMPHEAHAWESHGQHRLYGFMRHTRHDPPKQAADAPDT